MLIIDILLHNYYNLITYKKLPVARATGSLFILFRLLLVIYINTCYSLRNQRLLYIPVSQSFYLPLV